eukprot:10617903-Alexandrium_andersonii.AAC.1
MPRSCCVRLSKNTAGLCTLAGHAQDSPEALTPDMDRGACAVVSPACSGHCQAKSCGRAVVGRADFESI